MARVIPPQSPVVENYRPNDGLDCLINQVQRKGCPGMARAGPSGAQNAPYSMVTGNKGAPCEFGSVSLPTAALSWPEGKRGGCHWGHSPLWVGRRRGTQIEK
jgi:hypothetical protein